MLNQVEQSVQTEVASPCIKLCKINSTSGLCEGCLRTIEEITVWSKADRELKLRILKSIDERKLQTPSD